jgi:hypothetical protein
MGASGPADGGDAVITAGGGALVVAGAPTISVGTATGAPVAAVGDVAPVVAWPAGAGCSALGGFAATVGACCLFQK